MDKRIRIIGIAAAVVFSIVIITSPDKSPPIPDPNVKNNNEFVEILATNLEKPWAIDFWENKIFITEKVGRVRVVESNILQNEPLATFRTPDAFGGGLLGITVHPDFSINHFLYVYLTYEQEGKLWNKVLRITESENKLSDVFTIVDKIPGSKFNNGGVIKFGPDRLLYIGTGTPSDSPYLAQDLSSLAGKVLRLTADGLIPDDNPIADSPVYSYGHRNPTGMAWDESGNLYITELGPSVNDEINQILPGKNYGWPEQECFGDEKFENAIKCYDPGIEPGGIVFYAGNKLNLENYLILSSLRTSNLYALNLDEKEIVSHDSILSGFGRIRDANEGPDDYIYIITSNTDGKGFPDKNDDKLVRILK